MRPSALLLPLLVPLLAFGQEGSGQMTLEEAISRAEKQNEALRIAEQNVATADVNTFAAWTELYPNARVEVSPGVSNGVVGGPVLTPPYGATGSVIVSQPLLRLGVFSGVDAAKRGVENADALRHRTKEQLLIDVTSIFISVLRTRQQLQVVQAAAERAAAEEKAVAARVLAGGALRTAQLQSSINRRTAQFQVLTASRVLGEQEATFERLVGVKPPENLLLPPTPKAPTLDEAMEFSKNRADMQAAEERVRIARATETQLNGRFWPRMDLSMRFDAIAPLPVSPPGTPLNAAAYQAFAILTIPLFEADTRVNTRRQAISTQIALFQQSQLRRVVTEEIMRAVVQFDTAEKAAALAAEQEKDARENYDLVTNQFKLRAVSFIEVIQAQAYLTEAQNQILVAKYDRELASYQLLFASGALLNREGWKPKQ